MTAPTAPTPPVRAPSAAMRSGFAALALLAVLAVGISTLVLTHAPARHVAATRAQAPDLNMLIHGAPLQRARCSNWLGATAAERGRALQALAATVGAPTEYRGVRARSLTHAQAYTLLDNACAQPVARNFLIYILYARAAGFGGAGL